MTPARAPQSTVPNWIALLASILLAAPVVAVACGIGTRFCLMRAFPDDSGR